MRSSTLSTLLALSASAAALSIPPTCRETSFVDQIARLSCGKTQAIAECLTSDIDLSSSRDVARCFVRGGCAEADAAVGAAWLAEECRLTDTKAQDDLRKRQETGADAEEKTAAEEKTEAAAKTATKAEDPPKENTPAPATPAPTAAAAANPPSTAAAAAAAATTADTTSPVTAASAESTDNPAGTTLECSTTKMVSTKICVYVSNTKSCEVKQTPSSRCAPGVICQTDAAGNGICMKADNSLSTSGLVVALIFGLGVGSFLLAVIVMCCKDRRAFKKAEAIRRNALGVYKPDVEGGDKGAAAAAASFTGKGKTKASEAHLPLMTASTTRLDRERSNNSDLAGRDDWEAGNGRDRSPMGDAPQLHPGLGALGQDTAYNRL